MGNTPSNPADARVAPTVRAFADAPAVPTLTNVEHLRESGAADGAADKQTGATKIGDPPDRTLPLGLGVPPLDVSPRRKFGPYGAADKQTGATEIGDPPDRTLPLGLGVPPLDVSPRRKLGPCVFGTHMATLKGEDGLRVERVAIGGDVVTVALLCDGHGGCTAAAAVIDDLLPAFAEFAAGDASKANLHAAAARAFGLLHERIRSTAFRTTSGTTATLCLINETRAELTCCSVGDSFAILAKPPHDGLGPDACADASSSKQSHVELTRNPRLEDSKEECERVRAAGGKLGHATNSDGIPGGPLRAWPGGISSACSLGDSDCGDLICARPHCVTMDFPASAAVVMASDGLWDSVNFSAATKLALGASDPGQAAERLVSKALRSRGLRDDTTVIVLVGGSASHRAESHSCSELSSADKSLSSAPTEAAPATADGTRDKRRSSAFAFSSILRTPARIAALHQQETTVKGGRIFEALATLQRDPSLTALDRGVDGDGTGFVRSVSKESMCSSSSSEDLASPTASSRNLDESLESLTSHEIPLFAFMHGAPSCVASPYGKRPPAAPPSPRPQSAAPTAPASPNVHASRSPAALAVGNPSSPAAAATPRRLSEHLEHLPSAWGETNGPAMAPKTTLPIAC